MVNKKVRVLVVDDEQVVCDVLHDDLSERDYLCTTVLTGDDALFSERAVWGVIEVHSVAYPTM